MVMLSTTVRRALRSVCAIAFIAVALNLRGHAQGKAQVNSTEKTRQQKKNGAIRVLVPDLWGGQDKGIVKRLRKLKFEVVHRPWQKLDPDRLELIDVIFLPTQWAEQKNHYQHFESKKKAFHAFVKRGGGLLVCQPNPASWQDGICTPTLLPYPITFKNWYDKSDPACINLDPNHFITEDLPAKDMPQGERI